jgi:hypothetical protein
MLLTHNASLTINVQTYVFEPNDLSTSSEESGDEAHDKPGHEWNYLVG